MFSERLLDHARSGLITAWDTDREDQMPAAQVATGMDAFREQTLALPTSIGAALAKKQSMTDKFGLALEQGDGHSLVTLMNEEGYGPLPKIAGDAEVFAGLFKRTTPVQVVAGNSLSRSTAEPVLSGSTLTFPVGVFGLADFPRSWSTGMNHGKDITIQGQGMDHTLIVLDSDLSARVAIHNLTIRNCTLFTNNNYLFDLRREPASISLQHMRLCGFDKGAGGSCAFGTRELLLRASDSIITGGYGRHPGGQILRASGNGLLARFDRCTLSRTSLGHITERSTVHFESCTFEDFTDISSLAQQNPGVTNNNGTVLALPKGIERQLDMNDLFPNWKERKE